MGESEYKTDKVITGGQQLRPNEFRLEGVPVAGGPHHKINYTGDDVEAVDEGGNQVRVTVTGVGGGVQDLCLNLTPPSGSWVGPTAINTTSAFIFPNRAWFVPIVLTESLSFDQIGIHSAELSGPVDFELGLYDHVAGYPDSRLTLAQNPGAGVNGDNKLALPSTLNLDEGVYWLALWNGATGQNFQGILTAQTKESNAMQFNTGASVRVPSLSYQLLTAAGLPATVTAASLAGHNVCPMVQIRRL